MIKKFKGCCCCAGTEWWTVKCMQQVQVTTFKIQYPNLKQQYVTLTPTQGFEKRNIIMLINIWHKTAILVKPGHILFLWFSLWCPTTALSVCSFLFSEAVPNNYLLLQLQLQSAGSLHVAFRNLRKSQSWGQRTLDGKPENMSSVKYDPHFIKTAILWNISRRALFSFFFEAAGCSQCNILLL